MKKYIIHYSVLKDRRDYINSLELSDKLWIEPYDKESLSGCDIKYVNDRKLWDYKCSSLYKCNPSYRELNLGDISCFEKHILSWCIIFNGRDEYGLILEDDCIFCERFEHRLSELMNSRPKCDLLFIGGLYPHEMVSKTIGVRGNYHKKSHPATNTSCAYIISKRAAEMLFNAVSNGYTMPSDLEMNYWLFRLGLEVYHYIPYLIKEGSGTGHYRSSLR